LQPDKQSIQADESYLEAEIESIQLQNEQLKQNLGERKKYASRVFWLIVAWLVGIFVVLGLQGFSLGEFNLSDNVLITLIAGTTGSVLGIFIVIAKYLFPSKN